MNKRLVWWTSFIFILGILACCISGFVTTNRFGFALEGAWCAFDRFYYDSIYGQLKETYPKWEGFDSIVENLTKLSEVLKTIKVDDLISGDDIKLKKSNEEKYFYDGYFSEDYLKNIVNLTKNDDIFKQANQKTLPIASKYGKIVDASYKFINMSENFEESLEEFKGLINDIKDDFKIKDSEFLSEFHYYAKIARGWGKILTMIYLCLLCITITLAGVSMMFYACLRRQGYLSIFMHVLWNIVRFFMFSFFFYGAAYGMCYLGLRDAVAYVMFVFGEENLLLDKYGFLVPSKEGKKFYLFV